jgi:hypothetical protein
MVIFVVWYKLLSNYIPFQPEHTKKRDHVQDKEEIAGK